MLWLIGLGLADETDISVKGLELVRSCSRIYIENYTSILHVDHARLEAFYGRPIELADRESIELNAQAILNAAEHEDVALLVVGDPFGATTHADLQLRAHRRAIKVGVVHNASIMNAAAACGLQLYSFGLTVSIVFFTPSWRPESFYDRIALNKSIGAHTLCLLDIKIKEVSDENLLRGIHRYEPPRFMSVNQAVEQLLAIEVSRNQHICRPDTIAIALARIGAPDQVIRTATLAELLTIDDLGGPLHSLVLPGASLHELEFDLIKTFVSANSALASLSLAECKSRL